MQQDIIAQLMASANQHKNFADRLRDERNSYKQNASQFIEQVTPEDMYATEGGVPRNPINVSQGRDRFISAVEQAASPYSPELEMTSRGQADNLLLQLAQLTGQSGASGVADTGMSEADLLKLRQQRLDQNLDTSDIDEILGIRGAIGENEVQAVGIIDEILGLRTAGATGLIRAGIIKPYETQEVKNKLKQIDNILQMAKAGELKGQGQISDGERQILADAASSLGISDKGTTKLKDETLRRELKKIQTILAKKSNDPNLIQQYSSATQGVSNLSFDEDKFLDSIGL